jgi:dTDP-L-rhamnose 4-epimerase
MIPAGVPSTPAPSRRERVLITGGAGFIGSHVADLLLASGREVVAYDNLDSQVHGQDATRPSYLNSDVQFIQGDVRDLDRLAPWVRESDVVVHFAAAVGVGQSMYEIVRYTDVNAMGAASILQVLADDRGRVRKLLVASSMSIYGEGAYVCMKHGEVAPRLRSDAQLARHDWELRCPECTLPLEPRATGEDKPLYPTSIYAINKRDHEEMFLAIGAAYGIPTVAMRFFNAFGSRQALSNPYTGVAAIFCSRLLNGNRPLVFEDGRQSRDFVHVSDIARGCLLGIEKPEADGQVFNLGSGRRLGVIEVARLLAQALGKPDLDPEVTQQYRAGDIRHCYADLNRARTLLGYEPSVTLEEGIPELVDWVASQSAVDQVSAAAATLKARGLAR